MARENPAWAHAGLSSQEWSNGKVAIYGASGYAMVAWLVAAEQPPSLAVRI